MCVPQTAVPTKDKVDGFSADEKEKGGDNYYILLDNADFGVNGRVSPEGMLIRCSSGRKGGHRRESLCVGEEGTS